MNTSTMNSKVAAPMKSGAIAGTAPSDSQTGRMPGGAIPGFGGSKPHTSTMGESAGKAGHSAGSAVQGFSGTGIKPGKV